MKISGASIMGRALIVCSVCLFFATAVKADVCFLPADLCYEGAANVVSRDCSGFTETSDKGEGWTCVACGDKYKCEERQCPPGYTTNSTCGIGLSATCDGGKSGNKTCCKCEASAQKCINEGYTFVKTDNNTCQDKCSYNSSYYKICTCTGYNETSNSDQCNNYATCDLGDADHENYYKITGSRRQCTNSAYVTADSPQYTSGENDCTLACTDNCDNKKYYTCTAKQVCNNAFPAISKAFLGSLGYSTDQIASGQGFGAFYNWVASDTASVGLEHINHFEGNPTNEMYNRIASDATSCTGSDGITKYSKICGGMTQDRCGAYNTWTENGCVSDSYNVQADNGKTIHVRSAVFGDCVENDCTTTNYPYTQITSMAFGDASSKYKGEGRNSNGDYYLQFEDSVCAYNHDCWHRLASNPGLILRGGTGDPRLYSKLDKNQKCTRGDTPRYKAVCQTASTSTVSQGAADDGKIYLENDCSSSSKVFTPKCESEGYSFTMNGKTLHVNGARYGTCGGCKTSSGYYDTSLTCRMETGKYCTEQDNCYVTCEKAGMYSSRTDCLVALGSNSGTCTQVDNCWRKNVDNNYFTIKLHDTMQMTQTLSAKTLTWNVNFYVWLMTDSGYAVDLDGVTRLELTKSQQKYRPGTYRICFSHQNGPTVNSVDCGMGYPTSLFHLRYLTLYTNGGGRNLGCFADVPGHYTWYDSSHCQGSASVGSNMACWDYNFEKNNDYVINWNLVYPCRDLFYE